MVTSLLTVTKSAKIIISYILVGAVLLILILSGIKAKFFSQPNVSLRYINRGSIDYKVMHRALLCI